MTFPSFSVSDDVEDDPVAKKGELDGAKRSQEKVLTRSSISLINALAAVFTLSRYSSFSLGSNRCFFLQSKISSLKVSPQAEFLRTLSGAL